MVNPERKKQLASACLGQPAATTAPELIVVVARTDTWKKHSQQILKQFEDSPYVWPGLMKNYYRLGTRLAYGLGPVNINGAGKLVFERATSLLRASPTSPHNAAELKLWAVKTAALACENLMLAFRAAGYDTCPREGYDERRVRKAAGITGRHAHLVMVISAGKRAPNGVYGPRLRLPREQFVVEV
jgi:nitroreductase